MQRREKVYITPECMRAMHLKSRCVEVIEPGGGVTYPLVLGDPIDPLEWNGVPGAFYADPKTLLRLKLVHRR